MYLKPLKEVKFSGYIANNLTIMENGFAYICLPQAILDEYNVDAATAGKIVNDFYYIEEVISWGVFSEDKNNNNIRGSIRSRGPIINEVASKYGGGGHIFASGVKLESFDKVNDIVKDLDEVCKKYIEESKWFFFLYQNIF